MHRKPSRIWKAGCTQLNPAAPVLRAVQGEIDPGEILSMPGSTIRRPRAPDVEALAEAEAYEGTTGHEHDHDHHGHDHDMTTATIMHHDRMTVNRHDDRITAFCMTFDEPMSMGRCSPAGSRRW